MINLHENTYFLFTHFIYLHFFLKVSTRKLEDFTDTLAVFTEKFNRCGPGAVGDDLEKGVKTMTSKIFNWNFVISLVISLKLFHFLCRTGNDSRV